MPEEIPRRNDKYDPIRLAYGLDTDSFLRCLSRMWILSDRETNFTGASRELQELVDQLDQSAIRQNTVDQEIKWTFNLSLAPHL